MELTKKQEQAVKIIIDRYKKGERYAVLAGYAGTGKSTSVKFIVEYLLNTGSLRYEDIGYACFCGKAVQVLINKGHKNAVTLHKLLYEAKPLPSGKFYFGKKTELEYKIVIVDEASMVPQEMVDELFSHDIFIIFVGDPGQLPSIKNGNDLLEHPHAFLDEVMRQALDSGIIRLSMMIREGQKIDGFKSNDAIVIPKSELVTGHLLWGDQILCATNQTRTNINSQIRELKGYTLPIEQGEKLICLRNYWNTISDCGNSLTNGCIGTINNMYPTFQSYPKYLYSKGIVDAIGGTFITDTEDDFGNLTFDKNCILTGVPTVDGKSSYKINRAHKYKGTIPLEFTYAYCITTWKAQGSEWDKVLTIEENFPYPKEEHKQFLYTAVTRASKQAILVRG